jgi:hypothetical protein
MQSFLADTMRPIPMSSAVTRPWISECVMKPFSTRSTFSASIP